MLHTIARAVLSAAPATPPTEFRLFARGLNHTTKGDFIFDDTAARSVMAAYLAQGVELPIDLEHASLGDPASAARPDSHDARAWFKLALRNGELWATDVRWTPDGAQRLANRTQRYISPAFTHDDDGRVLEMVNCALVSRPATHNAPALVAASKYGVRSSSPVSVRINHAQLSQVRRLAVLHGVSVAQLVRLSIAALAKGTTPEQDPASLVAEVASALGLPATATPEDVLAKLQDLVTSISAPSDPAAEAAQAPPAGPPGTPPKPPSKKGALSASEIAACAQHNMKPQEYARRRDAMAARLQRASTAAPVKKPISLALRAELRARGLTEAEFEALKRDAVKRA